MNVLKDLIKKVTPEREVIGDPSCPIVYRWTLFTFGKRVQENSGPSRQFKVLLHHFLPNSSDRDPHDHPRSFLTFVLRGSYTDIAGVNGEVEQMRPGMVRYRPALHTHRTMTGGEGCWTLVVMGPLKRQWGFHREGSWWPYELYKQRFGHGMRCP